ncbi:MAG: NAD(P)/FAD-dependent oxidoreductase [Alphaproteobacteria bacterium]|nr:NAD(P)/FAD-dependent oxidoreductase [Alphaproteobacteria bacterium]
MSETPIAIIIGAGPAGLTAAYELLAQTGIRPLIFEYTDDVGGISRTNEYKGNYIDLGGHRFFSKSDRVLNWWGQFLSMDSADNVALTYQNATHQVKVRDRDSKNAKEGIDTEKDQMLVRNRVSRILFLGQFFDYPLSLSVSTILKLGLARTALAGLSYLRARLAPVSPETTLEHFLINRFGRSLYSQFFQDYTFKVWGVACSDIPAEWGRQRIKGLSITAALKHAFAQRFKKTDASIAQKSTETSLIERFLYPKYGPGQMWTRVSEAVRAKGGEIRFKTEIIGLETEAGKVCAVRVKDRETGVISRVEGDYYFSTMPVKNLIAEMTPPAPAPVREVAAGLMYRNFMTVGLLLKSLSVEGGVDAASLAEKLPDNWIYIQEPEVRVGRIQIFNNWSPYLVADPSTIWIGLEYFLGDDDDLWTAPEDEVTAFAIAEMEKIGFLQADAVLDSTIYRQPKAYPAYFGTYDRFETVREYTDGFENLFLIGRNGQHRYNNQDHSMLTAMAAVELIRDGDVDKSRIWTVNTEEDYHEEK